MPGKVTFHVVRGPMAPAKFTFDEHDTLVFGRDRRCHVKVEGDTYVSRHHFLVEVTPPEVRIRDLGSRNGTLVNGKKVGGRAPGEKAEEAKRRRFPEVDLRDGDEIRVGKSAFRVEVEVPPRKKTPGTARAKCAQCGKKAEADVTRDPSREFLCPECRGLARGDPAAVMPKGSVAGYEMVRKLGVGGMGAVYLARRERDGTWVALKVLLAQAAVDETARKRFDRECAILEQLSHENIVAFEERGAEGSAFWFAMEFCPGGSVTDLMERRGGRLPLGEAASIALDILDALAYAHTRDVTVELPGDEPRRQRGIVHRDVKPRNILLSAAGRRFRAKLSDFGLAKCFQTAGLSGCTVTGDSAGDFAYMPREQLLDFKKVTPLSDVWSMGATLYAMLAGVPPRDAPKGRDPLEVVLGGRTVPIRERMPELPARVAEVIDRAIAEEPSDRYPTAAEFREELERALFRTGPAAGSDETTGTVLHSSVSPSAVFEATLVLFDVVHSTRAVIQVGDTWFSSRVRHLHSRIRSHPSARALMYLKCTGDGFLAVYSDVAAALDAARSVDLGFGDSHLPLRRTVHFGTLRCGPGGDPLGADVHRLFRIEALREADRVAGAAETSLPDGERVVVTLAAVEVLPAEARAGLACAGTFLLREFDENVELWLA